MALSSNEREYVLKKYVRLQIDLAQGLTYCLNYKEKKGIENLYVVVKSLDDIIDKITS